MIQVKLTDRALSDLLEIDEYSIGHFGKTTAATYIDELEVALSMLSEHPDLLQTHADVSDHFKFYRVRQHFLVCTQTASAIVVLTIKHVAMDIPNRIVDLEPSLLQEAEILQNRLIKKIE